MNLLERLYQILEGGPGSGRYPKDPSDPDSRYYVGGGYTGRSRQLLPAARTFKSIRDIEDAMAKAGLHADQVSVRDGIVTIRKGYFYRHGMTPEGIERSVKRAFPEAKIVDSGDHWAPFRGGDSVARGSHMYVKFRLPGFGKSESAFKAKELAQIKSLRGELRTLKKNVDNVNLAKMRGQKVFWLDKSYANRYWRAYERLAELERKYSIKRDDPVD